MKKFFALMIFLLSSTALANPLPDVPHIYMEGSAEIKVEPDTMTVTVGLEATNMDVAIAKKNVDERSIKLIQACKKLGIKPKEISTTALQVYPQYDYRNSERVLTGTHVSRQVEIMLNDLNKYPEFMKALMDAKISSALNTALSVKNLKEVSDQALVKAMQNARQRAESLAATLSKGIGDVYSISEFQTRTDIPFTPVAGKMFASGVHREVVAMDARQAEPFEPGEIKVEATVYVVFLLK
jgi:hypothetical protein